MGIKNLNLIDYIFSWKSPVDLRQNDCIENAYRISENAFVSLTSMIICERLRIINATDLNIMKTNLIRKHDLHRK